MNRVTLATWRFQSGAVGALTHTVLQHEQNFFTTFEVGLAVHVLAVLTAPAAPACCSTLVEPLRHALAPQVVADGLHIIIGE